MDHNHFENLFEVTGRDFKQFKRNLLTIDIPVQEIAYGVKPSGAYYAILRADRPKSEKKRGRKPNPVDTVEVVDNVKSSGT